MTSGVAGWGRICYWQRVATDTCAVLRARQARKCNRDREDQGHGHRHGEHAPKAALHCTIADVVCGYACGRMAVWTSQSSGAMMQAPMLTPALPSGAALRLPLAQRVVEGQRARRAEQHCASSHLSRAACKHSGAARSICRL